MDKSSDPAPEHSAMEREKAIRDDYALGKGSLELARKYGMTAIGILNVVKRGRTAIRPKDTRHRILLERREAYRADYARGLSLKQVADKHHVAKATVAVAVSQHPSIARSRAQGVRLHWEQASGEDRELSKAQWREDYAAGMTMREIAEGLTVCEETVRRAIHEVPGLARTKANGARPMTNACDLALNAALRQEYADGGSLQQIAKNHGVSFHRAWKVIKETPGLMRTRSEARSTAAVRGKGFGKRPTMDRRSDFAKATARHQRKIISEGRIDGLTHEEGMARSQHDGLGHGR